MTSEAATAPVGAESTVYRRCNFTLTQLAAEQGIAGPQNFDSLLGAGADAWDSDEEFDKFISELRESRDKD